MYRCSLYKLFFKYFYIFNFFTRKICAKNQMAAGRKEKEKDGKIGSIAIPLSFMMESLWIYVNTLTQLIVLLSL